jgi:hypothetical protein
MSNWNSAGSGFWIGVNGSSVLTDVGEWVNNVTHNGGNALVDDTGLGEAVRTEAYDIGIPNVMNITYFINSTTSGIMGTWLNGVGTSQTVQFQEGPATYYSGSAIVGPVSHSNPIGLLTGSAEFHSDSGVGFTRTSVSLAA